MKIHKTANGMATIYLGDTMKIMPELIAAEGGPIADCIACDPPYLLTSGGGTIIQNPETQKMQGIFSADRYDNSGHLVACEIDWQDFMPLFFSALRRGHAYVMSNNRNVQHMLNAGEQAGFGFHNLLVWDKVTATPNRWYMKNCEFTGMFYKGKAIPINDCGSMSCIRYPHQDESQHPTEKPVALMEHFILNSTQPGQMVVDPFAGSGTTGVAAMRTGRRFIGIEQDERWFDTAVARIEAAMRDFQADMFR